MTDLGVLESFRSHLLRWNRQINLVSRQETEDRLDGLLGQCVGGHQVMGSWLEDRFSDLSVRSLCYFDLGSGGGLPGIVWHRLWVAQGRQPFTHLVEPREKRAWFLEHAVGAEDGSGFQVMTGRWGDVSLRGGDWLRGRPVVVISLKALHLDDREVLFGWERAHGGSSALGDIVIARYYPPEQILDSSLEKKLGVDPAGGVWERDDYIYRGQGVEVRSVSWAGLSVASLVLSSYHSSPRS